MGVIIHSRMDGIGELIQTEILNKLREGGFGDLMDAMLDMDNNLFTKKGRLKKSALARVMGLKVAQIDNLLESAKMLIEGDE